MMVSATSSCEESSAGWAPRDPSAGRSRCGSAGGSRSTWKRTLLGVVYAAETGFRLADDPDTVRAPDVAFVRQERIDPSTEVKGFFPGPPDLAVEVVSPGDTYSEVEEKVMTWLTAGAQMVLAVDPRKRTVTRYRGLDDIAILTEGDTIHGEDVVPGWTLRVADLFA